MLSRRKYLGGAAILSSVAVSGCTSVLGGEQSLTGPSQERDGPSVLYQWKNDGEDWLELSLTRRADVPGIDRLQVDVVQPQDSVLGGMEFRIQPAHTADTHADVFIEPPFTGGWESYRFYREDNWTVVDVDDFGPAGGSTVGFEIVIHGDIHGDEVVPAMSVTADFTLSKDSIAGDSYTASLSEKLDLESME